MQTEISLSDIYIENRTYTGNLSANMPDENGERLGTFRTYTVRLTGDRVTFRNCTFINTAGPGEFEPRKDHTAYFKNCYFEGGVDFIFGGATAYFYDCEMKSVEPGYIFAPSTPEHVKTGFVVRNCSFTRSDNVPDESVYIARPWREHARLTIENCSMDKHINPAYFHSFRDPESEKDVRFTIIN